jgi:hypothetical protein
VKIVPGCSIQAAALSIAKVHMQPVVRDLFESLPLARCLLTERARTAARKSNSAESVPKSVGIPAKPFGRPREQIVISEVWESGIVPHLINDLEPSVSQLPQKKQVLQFLGFHRDVVWESRRLQAPETIGLSAFGIDLKVVGNAILSQNRVEGNALDINGVALYPVSAGSAAIEGAELVSLLANPERNFLSTIDDPNVLDQQLLRCDLLLKPEMRALHENRIRFDCDHLVSLRQIVRRIIAIVHADVEDDQGLRSSHSKLGGNWDSFQIQNR